MGDSYMEMDSIPSIIKNIHDQTEKGRVSLHICENDCSHKRMVSAGEDVEQRKCLFVLMPLTQLLWKDYECLLEN